MGGSGGWDGGLAGSVRRLASGRYAPVAGASVLAILAVVQVQLPVAGQLGATLGSTPQSGEFALLLLTLAATLPAGLLWQYPAAAASVIVAANALSFLGYRVLTVGGVIAQVVVFYQLGKRGAQLLGGLLTVPFLLLGMAPAHNDVPARLACLLVVLLGPLAGWAGSAAVARSREIERSSAQQAIAGSMHEFTARGERARISRELHDVVAHHISMIAVQAETARLATPDLPAEGAQRLLAIGDTARSALTEMRRLLGVLREDTRDAGDRDPVAIRRPQPGLAQLTELLDLARDVSGAGTRLIVSGIPAELDPGVELAAYRIVQEALSNARRHAPGAAVDVELGYGDDGLRVRVRDNGPGPAPGQPAGHGLLGMRERAAAVGGEFRTGLAAGGGFVVEAHLPAGHAEAERAAAEVLR